jgi:L-glutamine-phosphate cytidylyltransferase
MRAVILAAGRGSRLAPLTDDRPKAMVALAGQPLIAWQMAALRGAGIDRIAVVSGYCAERLPRDRCTHFRNPRWADTQMVRSLACAEAWLAADDCIVSYADIAYGRALVAELAAMPHDIAISYDPDWLTLWQQRGENPLDDAETFRRDSTDGRLLEIGGKPASLQGIEGQYMGLLKFSPRGWRRVRAVIDAMPAEACDKLDMTSLLARLLRSGDVIGTVPTRQPWGEVDTASDLRLYETLIDRDAFLPIPNALAET